MGLYDGSITLSTQVDTKGIKKGAGDIKSALGSLSGGLKKIGTVISVAFITRQLVQFGKQAIELASDIQEVQNVVDVAFGDMAYKMEQFADTAIETYGISKLTAKRTGSIYMAMAKGMGVASEAASEMALNLTGLSADMASFYNMRQEETDVALKSVFTGETETLKRYGIVMTQVNLQEFARQQGITKSIQKMTQQEQVMLRYKYVLEQTKLAQGDFVRTSDSWANQTRILSERWKEMQSIFGEAFIVIGSLVMPAINTVIKALTYLANLAKIAATNIAALFGKKIVSSSQSAASSTGAIADNTQRMANNSNAAASGMDDVAKKGNKAAKEAKKASAAFDELQILSSGNDKSNSSGAGGGSGSFGDSFGGISSDGVSAIEDVQEGFSLFKDIDFEPLIKSLQGFWEALKPIIEASWNDLKWGFENVLKPLAKFKIEEVLPRFFDSLAIAVEGFGIAYEGVSDLVKDFIQNFLKPLADVVWSEVSKNWDLFNKELKDFIDTFNGTTAFQDLGKILGEIYKHVLNIIGPFSKFYNFVFRFALSSAFLELKRILKDVESIIGFIADLIEGDFKSAWEHFKDFMVNNKIEYAKEKLEQLKGAVMEMAEEGKRTVEELKKKIDDFIQTWVEKINNWWDEHVAQWFTAERWDELFEQIGVSLGIALNDFILIWTEKIPQWWENDVAEWFTVEKWEGIFDNIVTGITNFFTADDGFVKTWQRKIEEWWENDVAEWFSIKKWKEIGENMKNGILNGFKGVVNGISNFLNSIITGFEKTVNGAIGALNKIIEGYNKVADVAPGIPSIRTIGKVDLSSYKIPLLAQGAVIPANKEFLAVLGDQKQGVNIETPLDTMIQAFKTALSEFGGSGEQTVILQLDGREVGRTFGEAIRNESRRTGASFVKPKIVFG